jgi:predicted enzyme related to lactoylglutathione lyase/mannose-6-phosphate isomerase-like protein (cupin superfamily)
MTDVVDLAAHNIILDAVGGARCVAGGDGFWTALARGAYPELDDTGRLVALFECDSDWNNWEMHPDGEELVILISGRATFVLEIQDGEREIVISRPGEMIIVPRGTWHTARVDSPVRMLFVTAGKGTVNRDAGPRTRTTTPLPRYPLPTPGIATHLELGAPAGKPSATFFGALFGWPVHAMQTDNFFAQTPSGSMGIHPDDDAKEIVPYFCVLDLDAAVARVRELGGTAPDAGAAEGGFGRFAQCEDPQGVRFGLHQPT